jgi:hypothetical protein
MKIKILNSANNDLIDGYWFYEKQDQGLGAYFLDTLFSDIDSLKIYAGIHSVQFKKYYRLLSKSFLSLFTIASKRKQYSFMLFLIVVEIQHGLEKKLE